MNDETIIAREHHLDYTVNTATAWNFKNKKNFIPNL